MAQSSGDTPRHEPQQELLRSTHHQEPGTETVSVSREIADAGVQVSEGRYRTILERMDEGFCVVQVLFDEAGTAVDYRFLETNPAFLRHTGLHGAVGKRMRELVPDHEERWFQFYGEVAMTGEPARMVQRADALGGRWFDANAFRLGDPMSRNVAVLFTDITESKKAEDALRQSELRWRRAIEIETVGVIFFRPDGAVTFANDAFLRMSGYTRNDVENGLVRWTEMTPPEWTELSTRAVDEAFRVGHSTPYEKQYIRKDGSRWWALFATSWIDNDEGVKFIVDLTESKRAEEERDRLAAIVEYSRDAVIGISPEGLITDWNPAATELLGYTAAETIERNVALLMAADQPDDLTQAMERLKLGEDVPPFETVMPRRDGGRVEVEIRPSPVRNAGGRIVGTAAIVRDATMRKRLERTQDDFLAMASHDLRSPITVLNGRAQLMKRRKQYDEAAVDVILDQARRLERLVVDLQELVRFESGGIELERTCVDLGEMAQQAADRARGEATGHTIRVVRADAPITGQWDRDRLGQVLDNLVSNAVKYSPDGGDITIRIERHDSEVHLHVADHGSGVPADKLSQLFERFYQATKARSTGLGLGLYITRMLVEAHGGRIWAESEVDRGSIFSVALPLDG